MPCSRLSNWHQSAQSTMIPPMKIVAGLFVVFLIFVVITGISGCSTYNGLVSSSQACDRQWGQVQNVYQRRLDLIPNLVSTVQGAANF